MKNPNTPDQSPRITATSAFAIVTVLSSCTSYDAGQFAGGYNAAYNAASRPVAPPNNAQPAPNPVRTNYAQPAPNPVGTNYAQPAPAPVRTNYTQPAPNPAPNPGGYTRMSGRLTVVKNDGTTGMGSWSGTANQAGQQTSLIWTIDGKSVNFRMTGGTTVDGTTDDGTVSVRAAFQTRNSGAYSTSLGESGTFTAYN